MKACLITWGMCSKRSGEARTRLPHICGEYDTKGHRHVCSACREEN